MRSAVFRPKRSLAAVVAGAAVLSLVAAVPATAQQPATGAPAAQKCSDEPQDLPVHEFTDHRELGIELQRLERVSGGKIDVDEIGRSNRDREIWSARAGHGPKAVLLTSEIHGNEKTGTDALLRLLEFVGTSDSPKAERWRDELTIVAVPKMNPDAAELDRRGNDMTWDEVVQRYPQLADADPAWNYYTGQRQGDDYSQRPGFDINRDYNPDLSYEPKAADFPGTSADTGWYLSPETRAVRDVYVGLEEEFGTVDTYVDLHHQGACYVMPDDPDRFVTMSLSGKFVDDPAATPGYQQYADEYDLDYAKQLNVAAYNALQAKANHNPLFGNITLYPQDINLPGTGLGSFALNGSGAVLFEVRGQTQTLGQKYREQLVRTVYTGLDGMLSSLSSGQVDNLDPAAYDAIPPRGPSIGDTARTVAEP
nr:MULTISPECIES: M14 family zinc carboxypeptidase [Prauserella salsuginis group]